MTQVLEVTTTAPDQAAAEALAQSSVRHGYAAGAHVTGPVATYSWRQGECARGEAWTVTLRTVTARWPDLEAHLVAEHEQTDPAIFAVPVAHASASYARWVTRTTMRPPAERSSVSVAHEAAGDGFDGF